MAEGDPFATQRDVVPAVPAELRAAGFDNAHEIGRGGFGVVYRCMQTSLDRTVAVKVLTADLDEENRARFFREQRAMGRLTGHPNIVNVLHVGVTDSGRPYIVMQYHSQDSLEVQIRRQGPLALNEALRLGVKMAGALETAHRLGIIHRDVKPANILLTNYGEPALTDFGIAHIAGGFETATGTVTGSPAFTAPEVLRGERPSLASDLYGLGATLFCAITGHAAFERRSGEQVVAQFLRITTQPLPDLRERGIPDEVCVAIERAMSGDPDDRPAAAEEFGDELRQVQRRNGFPVDEMALQTEPGEVQRGREYSVQAHPSESDRVMPPAVRGKAGNLPLELTSFVGRRRELSEARKMLSASRLVTLTGIGGVGKTRLALRVAADMRRGFADGVWLVELDKLSQPALVPHAVLSTLGVADNTHPDSLEVLVDHLVDKQLLLVLDNCEHLVDACAELVIAVLTAAPSIHILASSREPLGVSGELTFAVPPLTTPEAGSIGARNRPDEGNTQCEALALFEDRAATVVPGFTPDPEIWRKAAELCRCLDGNPLAIELAVARLRVLSLDELLARLDERLRLLGGSRGRPPRHQTLYAAVDSSFELCSKPERQVWTCASVFAGSFDLESADAVCRNAELGSGAVFDSITGLVDKSILMREETPGPARFRMLETIRQYGRERLAQSGEGQEEVRRRHRDTYLDLAVRAERDWFGPRELHWFSRLRSEWPNLWMALDFCLTRPTESGLGARMAGNLWPLWLPGGYLREGRHWLDRAFVKHTRPDADRAKALWVGGLIIAAQGQPGQARVLLNECREIIEPSRDEAMLATATRISGWIEILAGDEQAARHWLEQSLRHLGASERIDGLAVFAYFDLGVMYGVSGDVERATEVCEQGRRLCASHGDSYALSWIEAARCLARLMQDPTLDLTDDLRDILRIKSDFNNMLGTLLVVEMLAWIAAEQGDAQRAARMLGGAETLWKPVGAYLLGLAPCLERHQAALQRIREALGADKFMRGFRSGAGLDAPHLVAYALGDEQDE